MKAKTIKRFQALIIIMVIGFTMGVLAAGGYRVFSLRFNAWMMFMTTIVTILILWMIRPWRYHALKIARRQRNKAIQRAQQLESTKSIIIQQTINNNMELIGNSIGGNVYGDSATHKENHFHFGNENKTMGLKNEEDFSAFPALALLSKLVSAARTPKEQLMPFRAAQEVAALLPPISSAKEFNELFGTDVSPANFTTYINADVNPYENDKDARQFRAQVKAFQKVEDQPTEE